MLLTREQITNVANSILGTGYAEMMAFAAVESGLQGFDNVTGNILIQFEPAWYRKNAPYAPSGKWSVNGVERQTKEREAFNEAFKLNAKAALLSTSIGMFQQMGFNYHKSGFKTVNEMWDNYTGGRNRAVGEYNQLVGIAEFIKNTPILWRALLAHDWATVALYYNGKNYKKNNYDVKLRNAYLKYSKL